MNQTGLIAGLALLGSMLSSAALADDKVLRRGERIVETYCARCHATGRRDASPLPHAPALRMLSRRYPLHYLAEALAEGIVTGHDEMPEFTFEPDDIEAVLAYMRSISEK